MKPMDKRRKPGHAWTRYHILHARRELNWCSDFDHDEEFALAAMALEPAAALRQNWVNSKFQKGYAREPDNALRFILAVRGEDRRLREQNPTMRFILHLPETRTSAYSDEEIAELIHNDSEGKAICGRENVKDERAEIRRLIKKWQAEERRAKALRDVASKGI